MLSLSNSTAIMRDFGSGFPPASLTCSNSGLEGIWQFHIFRYSSASDRFEKTLRRDSQDSSRLSIILNMVRPCCVNSNSNYCGEHIIVCIEHNKEGCTRLFCKLFNALCYKSLANCLIRDQIISSHRYPWAHFWFCLAFWACRQYSPSPCP